MREIKRLFWLNAIFYFILGCCLVSMPSLGITAVIITFGIGALVFGIIGTAFAIKNPLLEDRVLIGINSLLTAVIGLLLLCFQNVGETIIKIFVALLGVAIAIKGVMLIVDSFEAKKLKAEDRFGVLILGILLALIGGFMACNSLFTTLAFNVLVGIYLIAGSIAMVIWGIKTKGKVRKLKKELENIDEIEIEVK